LWVGISKVRKLRIRILRNLLYFNLVHGRSLWQYATFSSHPLYLTI
jgi:hypothetical protein